MARPSVQHNGFLIPNAQDVSDPILAEPDQIDFNTIADARWGVISGCALGEQGPLALNVGTGVAVVNGALVAVRGGTVTLSVPNTGARFTNVVVADDGVIRTIDGTVTADPVFPAVPLNNTLLATIYASAGAANLQDFVVDKRKFLASVLYSNVGPQKDLVVSYNRPDPPVGEPSQWFRINGQGDLSWADEDIKLFRSAPDELSVNNNFRVTATLNVNGDINVAHAVAVTDVISAHNLRRSNTAPTEPAMADLWQNTTTGVVSVGAKNTVSGLMEWQPLATSDTALPVGTVIDSVEERSVMEAKGWLALNGQAISEDNYPRLFLLPGMGPWISGGTAPHRTMTLPNLDRRFRLTDFDDVGKVGGHNAKQIEIENLPKHAHNVSVDTHGDIQPTAQLSGMSGQHSHPIDGDGKHDHDVYDKGHTHDKNFVAVANAGGSMLDGLVNDSSHTWKVDIYQTTATGYANIVAKPAAIGGLSISPTSGLHNHVVQVSKITGLTHNVNEELVGENEAFDVTPAYFTVRTFIRT